MNTLETQTPTQQKMTADPKKAAALRALSDFVCAAVHLNSAWGDDAAFLEHGYPEGLPSFDEFCEVLREWRDKAKAAAR